MRQSIRIFLTIIVVQLPTACSTTAVPGLMPEDIPSIWEQSNTNIQAAWPDPQWWQQFASDELNTLISEVELNNLDLAVNRSNLEQAQNQLRDAGFDLLPVPIVSLGLGETYTGNEPDGADYTDVSETSANLSLSLMYTDILSKPSEYASAKAAYQASLADAADVRLNTLSTASSTYFQILLLRDRVAAAESNVSNAEDIVRIAETRAAAGMITPLDVLQQRIAVDNEKASLRSLQQSEYAARSALALMLARSVQGFDVQEGSLEHVVIPDIVPGLPSSLLERRPDIARARASLVQASHAADLARLDYLPEISLTGSASLVSGSLSALLDSADLFVNAAASAIQTLLDNGSRRRNSKRARLVVEAELANYRRVVIAAFNDVEVNLSNLKVLEDLAEVASRNLELAEEAFRIAEVRYREGAVDYQTVLTAQTTLFNSRNSYLENKLARLNAVIALYIALGGGWQQADANTDS